jgi:hypothetical protein
MTSNITYPAEVYQAVLRERDMLRAEINEVWANIAQERNDLRAENERLRNLLAECFPLVRPGTDLSRRLRETLARDNCP